MIIAVCWTFTSLAILFVASRIFVRSVVHRRLYSDDYWILLSVACAIISNILVTLSVHWGNGKHFVLLSTEQKENTIKWMIAAYIPGIETLGFPKMAVIALLARLLSPSRKHLYLMWTMGTICCMSLTAMVLTLILQCTPPRALWDFSVTGTCLPSSTLEGLAFWASTFSAFLDFYLAIYPAIVLWKLQMAINKKIALTCALGMGFLSGSIGIVKATGVPTLSSADVSYELCNPLYWTSIEGNVIIIAACIPILQPLLEMIRTRKFPSAKKGSSKDYSEMSKQSRGHQDPIELQSKPKKKTDAYGFTIIDRDSEESIVGKDKDKQSTAESSGNYSPGEGGIMKTDVVTVTYNHGEDGVPSSAATRWAAV